MRGGSVEPDVDRHSKGGGGNPSGCLPALCTMEAEWGGEGPAFRAEVERTNDPNDSSNTVISVRREEASGSEDLVLLGFWLAAVGSLAAILCAYGFLPAASADR